MKNKIYLLAILLGLCCNINLSGQVAVATAEKISVANIDSVGVEQTEVKKEVTKKKKKSRRFKHEFGGYVGGGLSTLKFNSKIGKQKNGIGGMIGADYKLFFNEHFGIGTGFEFAVYNAKVEFSEYTFKSPTRDMEGNDFEFRSNIHNYKEDQKAYMLNIPVMLQYQTKGQNKFYAAGGMKLAIPMSGKYKVHGQSVYKNSGYYEFENIEYTDLDFMGFGAYRGQTKKKNLDLKTSVMMALEAGMKWELKDNLYLYTGAYFDYGFKDIVKNQRGKYLVEYNTQHPKDFQTNSVVLAKNSEGNFNKKIVPMAAGIKIKIAFGPKSNKKADVPEITPVDPAEVARLEAERKHREEEAMRKAKDEEAERQRRGDELLRIQREKEAAEKQIAEQEKKKYEEAKAIIMSPISQYRLNQVYLSTKQKAELDEKIKTLKENSQLKITTEGHTCSLGNNAVNDRISRLRAENVRKYMISHGIDAERIRVVAKGKHEHAVKDDTEAHRRMNRRVEILLEE